MPRLITFMRSSHENQNELTIKIIQKKFKNEIFAIRTPLPKKVFLKTVNSGIFKTFLIF